MFTRTYFPRYKQFKNQCGVLEWFERRAVVYFFLFIPVYTHRGVWKPLERRSYPITDVMEE